MEIEKGKYAVIRGLKITGFNDEVVRVQVGPSFYASFPRRDLLAVEDEVRDKGLRFSDEFLAAINDMANK